MLKRSHVARWACLAAALFALSPAWADHYGHHDHGGWHDHGYWHDTPHYYPRPGIVFGALPGDFRLVVHGGSHFYLSGGVWFRPYGPRYVVVAPPLGIVVPILPPYYVTYPYGGVTYYVANDVYYVANPAGEGYVVSPPPSGGETAVAPAAPTEKVFVYPRNGQSKEHQEKDRYECHAWAVSQTGFDPSAPQGGVGSGQVDAKRADYKRANEACLEGRGYTVK